MILAIFTASMFFASVKGLLPLNPRYYRIHLHKLMANNNSGGGKNVKSKKINVIEDEWKIAIDRPTLVIVESPAKAKTIQKYLDENLYIVDYCAGHIRDLAKAKDVSSKEKNSIIQAELKLNVADVGVDVFNDFNPIYVPMEDKSGIISKLKKQLSKCSRLLLASDEDREGEALSWSFHSIIIIIIVINIIIIYIFNIF